MRIKDEILDLEQNLRAYEDTTFRLLRIVNDINSSIEALGLDIPENQLNDLIDCLLTEIAYVEYDLREAIGDDIYDSE